MNTEKTTIGPYLTRTPREEIGEGKKEKKKQINSKESKETRKTPL